MEQCNVIDKRKSCRYATDATLKFRIAYDFSVKVSFKVDEEIQEGREQDYTGFSKDISVCGLSFETAKALEPGDVLWIDLQLPNSEDVFSMKGEVCWCRSIGVFPDNKPCFRAGIEISEINGVDVEQTVYFDKAYNVAWSELLERVLGTFAKINRKSV